MMKTSNSFWEGGRIIGFGFCFLANWISFVCGISPWHSSTRTMQLSGMCCILGCAVLRGFLKRLSRMFYSFVQLNQESTRGLCEKYSVPSNMDTFLLFHEDDNRPVARLSMADLPYAMMKDVIDANKYLELPRLSSQVTIAVKFLKLGFFYFIY